MKKILVLAAVCGLIFPAALQAQSPERVGGYEISVRTIKPAEMPDDTSGEWLEFVGPGVASGALGLAAPPMYASGLVVGGILLAPGALILSNIDRRKWQRVAGALQSVAFEQDLKRAMHLRAAQAGATDSGEVVSVELVINSYGVDGSMHLDRVCFIASLDLVVNIRQREVLRDRLNISDANRSADAPPPQCASLGRFAENEGQLVRDCATEYVEVLAAMSFDRIRTVMKR